MIMYIKPRRLVCFTATTAEAEVGLPHDGGKHYAIEQFALHRVLLALPPDFNSQELKDAREIVGW